MRFQIFAGLGLVVAALAGCVAPAPMVTTAPATTVITPAPTMLDVASQQVARTVISSEMEKRLPGANVAPYTDCVVNNATTAELIDIAQAARAGVAGTADSVAAIVSRPATTQCIAAAARTA